MKTKDSIILKSAINFASKFGFLTQSIFFEFLCPRGKTQQYDNWNKLIQEGYFVPSRRNPKLLYFTPKGFAVAGPQCVKRRYFYYIEHDSVAAKLLLHLQSTGKVLNSWTEAELRASPWEAIRLIGASDATKLPDLIVDLQGAQGFVRVAFEIEASRKSRERYDQIAFSYLGMKKINLVIFVCENKSLEAQVQRAFAGAAFSDSGKSPVTLMLEDIKRDWLLAKSTYMKHEIQFSTLLSKALKTELSLRTDDPNKGRTAVRPDKNQKNSEAA